MPARRNPGTQRNRNTMQKLKIELPYFSIEIAGEHERDVIKKASFWLSLPVVCPHCGGGLKLNYRTPKNFEYFEVACAGQTGVVHSINLGQTNTPDRDLYFDDKKSWYSRTVGRARLEHSEQPDERFADPENYAYDKLTPTPPTPVPALSARVQNAEPGVVDSGAAANAMLTPKRNDLLKLISRCKAAGVYAKLNPADVVALDLDELDQQINRLGAALLQGATK
jgi:hypothetical protein